MVATAAGFPLILIGGVLSGVFSIPMKSIKGWNWENIWLTYCIWGATIFPLILCFSVTKEPGIVFDSIRDVYACLCGLGWGVGSVLFGLGIIYVGNALTFGITLSLSSTVGSILPLLVFQTESAGKAIALFYWAGLLVAIVGVVILSWAGVTKENELQTAIALSREEDDDLGDMDDILSSPSDLSDNDYSSENSDGDDENDDGNEEEEDSGRAAKKKKSAEKKNNKPKDVAVKDKSSQMKVGIIICVVSGIFSAMLNVGLASGDPIRVKAEETGTPKSWVKYREQPMKVFLFNFFITFCMGLMWFGGLLVYGIGTIVIGDLGTSVGWPMYMVAMVLSSNIGAIIIGEWKGTMKKSRMRMGIGLGFLAVAVVLLALGSSLDDGGDENISSSSSSGGKFFEFSSEDSNSTWF